MKKRICAAILLLAFMCQPVLADDDKSRESKTAESKIPAEEAHFTPEQLEGYYASYKLIPVQYLRTVFNNYLKGHGDREDEFKVLSKWPKDYYKSKFIVCSVDKAMFGGSELMIMFQDRPDKVFQIWVYNRGGKDGAVLRAMDAAKFTDEDIKNMKIRYRQFLADKVHAM